MSGFDAYWQRPVNANPGLSRDEGLSLSVAYAAGVEDRVAAAEAFKRVGKTQGGYEDLFRGMFGRTP